MSNIQKGFPKLAKYHPYTGAIPFWRSSRHRVIIPSRTGAMWRGQKGITLKDGDLVILVANEQVSRYDYSSASYKQYNLYYCIPIVALENDWLPITAITRWRKKFKKLPTFLAEELEIMDSEWIMKNDS